MKMKKSNTCSLLIPVYRELNQRFTNSLRWFLKARIKGLDAEIEVVETGKWYTRVKLRGSDAKTARIFLRDQLGAKRTREDLSTGEEYAGNIFNITSDSCIVDIGISEPRFLIRIPFTTFFEECFGLKGVEDEELFHLLGLRKYFPVNIELDTLVPVKKSKYLGGTVGSETVKLLTEWFRLPYNRVLVYGETRGRIKKALSKSGHGHDVLNIERIGFLECNIVCKKATSAVGLLPEIGPHLKEAELTTFQVDPIREEINAKQEEKNRG